MSWLNDLFSWLGNFIANAYAVMASVPFLAFLLLWFIVYGLTSDKKKATATAMDITTLLLFGVVAAMLDLTFQFSFGGIWLLLLIFLIALGLIGNAQHRLHGRINVKRQLRVVWRLGFLGLGALYFVLLLIGLSSYIFSS